MCETTKSAYEIALENGFKGTPRDFLNETHINIIRVEIREGSTTSHYCDIEPE